MFKKIINYIKDFVDKCIFFYNNDEVYKKRTKNILFLFLGIDVVFLIVCYFINKLDVYNYIIFSLIVFAVWFVVQVLYSFFVVPSDYIQPNIDKLPNKIWNYPVVVQYNLPKWLNPSEVGLLYDLKSNSTNFDCLFYKWEYEWFIKIEDRGNWSVLLDRIGEIGDDVPSYEKHYWNIVFWVERKDSVIWKWNQLKLDQQWVSVLHSELLNHCVKQWIIYKKQDILFIISLFWAFWGGFIFWYALWVLIIIFSFVYIFSSLRKRWNYLWKIIWRTDKWNELLAHIIGYKYWLEKCEEEQVKKILNEDTWFKSRDLPYIVALRMDWKFLNGKFNK